MVEGGKIDHACHGNDAATAFEEVIDMDNAVKVAYEFYKKHPKETLIVVTADHETGGMGLGTIKYELSLKSLASQKQSQDILSRYITNLRNELSFRSWIAVFEETLYARTEPLAAAAKKVMYQIAMVGWTSVNHTAGYVPVFAIGIGSELFKGKMDNTEIPKRIAKAAGYK